MCLKASTDWNCGNEYSYLQSAVQNGLVSESLIDQSLSRVLKARIMLGQFDPEELDPFRGLNMSVVATHETLARQAARESIVLLKNDKKLLPLDLSKFKSVAIVGPCANSTICPRGDYDPDTSFISTPFLAFQSNSKLKVSFAPGCSNVFCKTKEGFQLAISTAKAADLGKVKILIFE